MRKRIHHKTLAVVLTFCMLISESTAYAQALPPAPSAWPLPSAIQIPGDFGTIKESYAGTSGKTIIYLQDAHDSLDAQKNIANLIHSLVRSSGVKTVYEEGYEGEVPTDDYFGFIQDPELRQKTSFYFLDQLKIGGAEYAHINRALSDQRTEWKLIGADDRRLFLENIKWYQRSAIFREAVESDLNVFIHQFRRIIHKDFPKEIKQWLKLREKFDRHELPLWDYLKQLLVLNPQDLGAYPQILNLFSMISSEEVIPMDTLKLFAEIERLESSIVQAFVTAESDREILEIFQTLNLLKRLNRIEISEEEYEFVKSKWGHLDTEALGRRMAEIFKRPVVLSKWWEEIISVPAQFYKMAYRRDQAIEQTLGKFLKNQEEKTAILVFGGFHEAGIKEILKKQGFSYLVVMPRIESLSEKHEKRYIKRMTGRNILPAEETSVARIASRPPTVFLTPSGRSEVRQVFRQMLTEQVASAIHAGKKAKQHPQPEFSHRQNQLNPWMLVALAALGIGILTLPSAAAPLESDEPETPETSVVLPGTPAYFEISLTSAVRGFNQQLEYSEDHFSLQLSDLQQRETRGPALEKILKIAQDPLSRTTLRYAAIVAARTVVENYGDDPEIREMVEPVLLSLSRKEEIDLRTNAFRNLVIVADLSDPANLEALLADILNPLTDINFRKNALTGLSTEVRKEGRAVDVKKIMSELSSILMAEKDEDLILAVLDVFNSLTGKMDWDTQNSVLQPVLTRVILRSNAKIAKRALLILKESSVDPGELGMLLIQVFWISEDPEVHELAAEYLPDTEHPAGIFYASLYHGKIKDAGFREAVAFARRALTSKSDLLRKNAKQYLRSKQQFTFSDRLLFLKHEYPKLSAWIFYGFLLGGAGISLLVMMRDPIVKLFKQIGQALKGQKKKAEPVVPNAPAVPAENPDAVVSPQEETPLPEKVVRPKVLPPFESWRIGYVVRILQESADPKITAEDIRRFFHADGALKTTAAEVIRGALSDFDVHFDRFSPDEKRRFEDVLLARFLLEIAASEERSRSELRSENASEWPEERALVLKIVEASIGNTGPEAEPEREETIRQLVAELNRRSQAVEDPTYPYYLFSAVFLSGRSPGQTLGRDVADMISPELSVDQAETELKLIHLIERIADFAKQGTEPLSFNLRDIIILGTINPSPKLREAAAIALGEISAKNDEEIISLLRNAIRREDNPNFVKIAALRSLANLDDTDSIKHAILSEDPNLDESLVLAAIEALGQYGEDAVIYERLIEDAFDGRENLIVAAISALEKSGRPDAALVLGAFLSHKSARIRRTAMDVFNRIVQPVVDRVNPIIPARSELRSAKVQIPVEIEEENLRQLKVSLKLLRNQLNLKYDVIREDLLNVLRTADSFQEAKVLRVGSANTVSEEVEMEVDGFQLKIHRWSDTKQDQVRVEVDKAKYYQTLTGIGRARVGFIDALRMLSHYPSVAGLIRTIDSLGSEYSVSDKQHAFWMEILTIQSEIYETEMKIKTLHEKAPLFSPRSELRAETESSDKPHVEIITLGERQGIKLHDGSILKVDDIMAMTLFSIQPSAKTQVYRRELYEKLTANQEEIKFRRGPGNLTLKRRLWESFLFREDGKKEMTEVRLIGIDMTPGAKKVTLALISPAKFHMYRLRRLTKPFNPSGPGAVLRRRVDLFPDEFVIIEGFGSVRYVPETSTSSQTAKESLRKARLGSTLAVVLSEETMQVKEQDGGLEISSESRKVHVRILDESEKLSLEVITPMDVMIRQSEPLPPGGKVSRPGYRGYRSELRDKTQQLMDDRQNPFDRLLPIEKLPDIGRGVAFSREAFISVLNGYAEKLAETHRRNVKRKFRVFLQTNPVGEKQFVGWGLARSGQVVTEPAGEGVWEAIHKRFPALDADADFLISFNRRDFDLLVTAEYTTMKQIERQLRRNKLFFPAEPDPRFVLPDARVSFQELQLRRNLRTVVQSPATLFFAYQDLVSNPEFLTGLEKLAGEIYETPIRIVIYGADKPTVSIETLRRFKVIISKRDFEEAFKQWGRFQNSRNVVISGDSEILRHALSAATRSKFLALQAGGEIGPYAALLLLTYDEKQRQFDLRDGIFTTRSELREILTFHLAQTVIAYSA